MRLALCFVISMICIAGAYAITCDYDPEPFLSGDIDWSCETAQDAQCLIGIFYNDTLISVSPSVEDVSQYGRISIMSAKNGILNFRLDTVDLYPGMAYNVTVFCHSNISSDEVFSGSVTPMYKPIAELPQLGIFIKDNLSYIIGAGILIFFVALIIIIIKVIL